MSIVIVVGLGVVLVAVNGHVRHGLICLVEDSGVVLLIVRIVEREVGGELDTVAHVVVEGHTGGETIELLLDDSTGLVVVGTGDTELCLLTTTRENECVVVSLTKLCNLVSPVGILIEVAEVHRTAAVIRDLDDVRSDVALRGVEVSLLEHHGVLISAEHLHTLGLP